MWIVTTSLGWYLAAPEHRPRWMRVDRLLGEHGIAKDTAAGRQEFEQRMEKRRQDPSDAAELKVVRHGWCLGGEEFRQRLLGLMEGKLGQHHSAQLRRETAAARGERIVKEELRRLGWGEAELIRRRKGDPEKMALAARLRKETTLTVQQIARRVHLGTSRSANARLHEWMRPKAAVETTKTGKEGT